MNTMKSPTTPAHVKNDQPSTDKRMDQYRGLLRASALYALVAAALLSFPLLSASAQTPLDKIRLNRNLEKCWHKKDPGTDNGNIIHLWDCDGGPIKNRTFFYEPSTGYIRYSLDPSKCLHKKTPGWQHGDTVHLWDCTGGEDENKTFDFRQNDERIVFRSNPDFCAGVQYLGTDNGNPIVVKPCKIAESYSMRGPKSDAAPVQGSVPCSNVRLASETLVLEVKTANWEGGGSSATMRIRIIFDDWDTGWFTLNGDRSFYAGGVDVIDTGIQIPGGCNRKGTSLKSMVIENKGSSGIFSADAWGLESFCARSSSDSVCADWLTIGRWIYGGGKLTWGLK